MKECPKHPEHLTMELWKFCPLCGRPLVESLAGIPVIISEAVPDMMIVSTETLHQKMQEETDRIALVFGVPSDIICSKDKHDDKR